MTLAKGARPRAALSRLLPILIGAGLLAGCQSASQAVPAAVRADDWRVIERSGEARYLAPGASTWAAALSATALPGGSRVVTGDGGRLILAHARDHVSAGPASRFSLPGDLPGATLEQTAGRLRYRLGEATAFAVATPALAVEAQGGAFEVTVEGDATEIAVERGRLRIATPDRQREIELGAGQSAEAGDQGALAFRRANGEPLQPVERIIMPALQPLPALPLQPALQPLSAVQPRPALGPRSAAGAPPGPQLTAGGAATNQASTSAAASIESAVVIAATGPGRRSAGKAASPAARSAAPATTETTFATMGAVAAEAEQEAVADDPVGPPAPVDPPATEEIREDPRLLFDRLTEGMVDALPAYRAPKGAPTHARPI